MPKTARKRTSGTRTASRSCTPRSRRTTGSPGARPKCFLVFQISQVWVGPYIADALFVSESTVRTHIRRILEKTDLHSKQQVIDLIEHYQ